MPLAVKHGAAGSNVRVVDDASGATLSTLYSVDGPDIALDAAGFLATSVPLMFVVARAHAGRWDDDVFLCDDGQVKVLDFGMAHAFGRRKLDGGTRSYMAPEQWRAAAEDVVADRRAA